MSNPRLQAPPPEGLREVLIDHQHLIAGLVSADDVASAAAAAPLAVDVAGGGGRAALWLTRCGFDVTLIDRNPDALASARERFRPDTDREAERFRAVEYDIEVDCLPRPAECGVARHALTDGAGNGSGDVRWDLIVITYFLHRPLLAALPEHLASGGLAVFAQPTVTNLERNQHPSERWCLRKGEIADIAGTYEVDYPGQVEVITATEAWRSSGAHEANLVFRLRF